MRERFLKYLKDIKGCSPLTINQYSVGLNKFYLENKIEKDSQLSLIKQSDIRDWLISLAEKGISPTSRNKYLAIIKSFYKYLLNQEETDIDYRILEFPISKTERKVEAILSVSEIQDMIMAAPSQLDKALIAYLASTGTRISEALNLTVEDIKSKGTDSYGNPIYYTIVLGKGNKQRMVPFNSNLYNTAQLINDYVNKQRASVVTKNKVNTTRLLLTNKGTPITPTSFNRTLKSVRSEEHTSELQSPDHLVCRLLLDRK